MSDMGLTGQSKVSAGLYPPEDFRKECFSSPFSASRDTFSPWLMPPSSIFKAGSAVFFHLFPLLLRLLW